MNTKNVAIEIYNKLTELGMRHDFSSQMMINTIMDILDTHQEVNCDHAHIDIAKRVCLDCDKYIG